MNKKFLLDERIRYFNRGEETQNFGDYLPELIAHELFLGPRVEADVYRLIGSVIDIKWLQSDLRFSIGNKAGTIAIWGCGARNDQIQSESVPDNFLFFGVRGALTRDVLGLPNSTALGDPGLLLPIFLTPQKNVRTTGKTICVKHVHDLRSDDELLSRSGADMILSPVVQSNLEALRELIDLIVGAEFVLTASLHAAIIAAAYNRPFAYWDNGILDIEFKWKDFSSSIGIETKFNKNVQDGRNFYEKTIKPSIDIPSLVRILEVCPFYIKPDYLLKAAVFDGKFENSEIKSTIEFLNKLEPFSRSIQHESAAQSKFYRASNSSFRVLIARKFGGFIELLKLTIRRVFKIK